MKDYYLLLLTACLLSFSGMITAQDAMNKSDAIEQVEKPKVQFKLENLEIVLRCDTIQKFGTVKVCFVKGEEKASVDLDPGGMREEFLYAGFLFVYFKNKYESVKKVETNEIFKIGSKKTIPKSTTIIKGLKFKIIKKIDRGYLIEKIP